MSGTSASSAGGGGGGLGLPAPVVRVGEFDPSNNTYQVPDQNPAAAGGTVGVTVRSQVSISVHGLPQAIFADLATYQPKLELMRYVRRRTTTDRFSRNFRTNGYVHPSSVAFSNPSGSHTHGGGHPTISGVVTPLRQTEWDVLNFGQVIDVTQGMLGFMHIANVPWRDSLGNQGTTKLVVPSGSSMNGGFGKRYPYAGIYYPGYYKFRWSIIDPSDDRGQRVTGPLSDTVSITTEVFPFIPAAADPFGRAAANLNPAHDFQNLRAWVGSVSRLPR